MPPKVKLRINPPRRRESERVKTRSASAATTPTTATSTSSAGDTIEVAHNKSSDAFAESVLAAPVEEVRGLTVDADASAGASEELPVRKTPAEPTELVGAQVVQAVQSAPEKQDEVMVDEDDNVTEYDFENEKEDTTEDDETEVQSIFTDAAHEIITISSDDDIPQDNFEPDLRPWLKQERKGREMRELMYCEERKVPVQNDWETTEVYQEMLDQEMDEYIKDFPLQKWVVGLKVAQGGLDRMLQRRKWRALGADVFQNQILDAMGFQPKNHQQQQQAGPPQHHQHHQAQYPNHVPHDHQQTQMPQHHMVHHGGGAYGPGSAPMPPAPHVLPSNLPMQQVGYDYNGQPVYQPVQPSQHHQRPQPPMAPPSRPRSLPQVPQQVPQKRQSTDGTDTMMQPYLPEKGRRKRQKQDGGATSTALALPVDSSLLPPYAARAKPASDTTLTSKSGKAGKRKADTAEFPWNRKLDFEAAKARATWSRTLYTPATLMAMDQVRERNAKYLKEKQKGSQNLDGTENNNAVATDPQTNGHFCYATESDQHKAMALAKSKAPLDISAKPSVEELMAAAELGQIEINSLDAIHICWSPGKKGLTQDLTQVVFTIRDTLLTRQVLTMTPILNGDAAECVVDFCPDLLFRDMLLRVTSESPLGNKAVRDRMCQNGNWINQATVTKRIGSALGNTQGADKTAADTQFYQQNSEDYHRYQLYFGHGRKGKRNGTDNLESSPRPGSSGSDGSSAVMQNGAKGKGKAREIVQLDGAADEVEEEEEEMESEDSDAAGGVDVVSVQSDGELDRLLGSDDDD